MKTLFIGAGDEIVLSTIDVLYQKHNLVGVITNDNPCDSEQIQEFAKRRNIPLYAFDKLSNSNVFEIIKTQKPDIIITFCCDLILREEILQSVKYGGLNIHFSLLPKYPGPYPTFDVFESDDKETGVTIHKLSKKVDCGDIMNVRKIYLDRTENPYSLYSILSPLVPDMLDYVLENFHEITPIKQFQCCLGETRF